MVELLNTNCFLERAPLILSLHFLEFPGRVDRPEWAAAGSMQLCSVRSCGVFGCACLAN